MSRRGLLDVLIWGGKPGEVLRDAHYHQQYSVPEQLAELVRQAHGTAPIRTMWDIRVSPEMRDALCAPLTPEQLQAIRAAEAGVFARSVSCYVVSHKCKGNELSGIVQVSLTVRSRYSQSEMAYPPIKLRIGVNSSTAQYGDRCWEVTSVEQVT